MGTLKYSSVELCAMLQDFDYKNNSSLNITQVICRYVKKNGPTFDNMREDFSLANSCLSSLLRKIRAGGKGTVHMHRLLSTTVQGLSNKTMKSY